MSTFILLSDNQFKSFFFASVSIFLFPQLHAAFAGVTGSVRQPVTGTTAGFTKKCPHVKPISSSAVSMGVLGWNTFCERK